jgi:hypothetical protein
MAPTLLRPSSFLSCFHSAPLILVRLKMTIKSQPIPITVRLSRAPDTHAPNIHVLQHRLTFCDKHTRLHALRPRLIHAWSPNHATISGHISYMRFGASRSATSTNLAANATGCSDACTTTLASIPAFVCVHILDHPSGVPANEPFAPSPRTKRHAIKYMAQ